MGRTTSLLAFLPQEFIPLLVVAGGLLLIVGARSMAMALFGLCGMMIILPPVIEAILNELPEWTLLPIMVIAILGMIGFLFSLVLGKGGFEQFKGQIAAQVFTWLFFLPFRLTGRLIRLLLGRR